MSEERSCAETFVKLDTYVTNLLFVHTCISWFTYARIVINPIPAQPIHTRAGTTFIDVHFTLCAIVSICTDAAVADPFINAQASILTWLIQTGIHFNLTVGSYLLVTDDFVSCLFICIFIYIN